MTRSRLVVVAMLTAGLTLTMAGPTSAGSRDPQPTSATASVDRPGADRTAPDATLVCTGVFSPVPQYSASNRTIHVGGHIGCNFVGSLHFRVNLYTLRGTGENETKVWQDFVDPGWKVGSSIGMSKPVACVGSASTRWIADFYGHSDIGNLKPYPLWSSVYTYPCGGLPD